ncbi:C-C motif chemokine 18-like isoform X2 [Tachysurus fulvidraco]|uniref:C-C motif chemokine 18-like isoform X2 n=2 Tax=Tachysurus fulvidraco TaxID=1234273 RepID=UPI001FEEFAE8|nr:C-C motif chemokine 18-like isoform X2 [Tachysurus fulvidraco]
MSTRSDIDSRNAYKPSVDGHIFIIHTSHRSARSSSPSAAMSSSMVLLLLLGLSCLQSFTKAQSASGADLCCFEFHKRPFPAGNVVSYEETRPDCTVPGVILTTKKGYRICADPEVDWVQQVIKIKNSA